MAEFEQARRWCDEARSILGLKSLAPPDSDLPAKGVVAYAKLQLRWRAAQNSAAVSMAAFGKAVLAHPEVQADERLTQVKQAVARLPGLIPHFGEELADHLDAAANGGPGAAKSRAAALKTIKAYRGQLAGVPVLAQLSVFAQQNLSVDLSSATDLDQALTELEQTLAAKR